MSIRFTPCIQPVMIAEKAMDKMALLSEKV